MRPSLLPLCLLPVCGIAQADATLYGQLRGSLGQHTGHHGQTHKRLDSSASKLGIKGHQEHGAGLQTIWQFEIDLALDGADKPASGESFVGVSDSGLGKLRLGYPNSPLQDFYKVNQWISGGSIEHAADGTPDRQANFGADALTVFSQQQRKRLGNAIRYDTPEFAGWQASIAYGFGENKRPSRLGKPGVERSSDRFAFGLKTRQGNWFGQYGFLREANPCALAPAGEKKPEQCPAQTDGSRQTANLHLLEAGYEDDLWLVALAYQQARGYDWSDGWSGESQARRTDRHGASRSAAQMGVRTRQAALSIARHLGAITPKVSLAYGWDQHVQGERQAHTGYRQWVIGADYALSKRTQVGIAHGRQHFDPHVGASAAVNNRRLVSTSLHLSHQF